MHNSKECVLNANKICNECGECEMCDLHPGKKCDNCFECITQNHDFAMIKIDKIVTDDSIDVDKLITEILGE